MSWCSQTSMWLYSRTSCRVDQAKNLACSWYSFGVAVVKSQYSPWCNLHGIHVQTIARISKLACSDLDAVQLQMARWGS
jgi:hypothetical protein